MFESMYFTMLMTPTYERPIDTAEDVIYSGLAVLSSPGTESIVETQKNSPYVVTRSLAELTVVAKVIFCIIA